ncbi:hypothetical protein Poli38472_013003 [Pythium oligandrum]|uniref:Uncharacterized protein n=1 Tax=Pythium oligandrum TaxID=41045 RepID=A0A8K1FIZ7_PYTOL|nr:hypothetical protein Poli38472_013003 [Pythium oligandrum]|eukprot:TMW64381.1 hypothetical protein Poli38472_013003 [Pythium oligandrum]
MDQLAKQLDECRLHDVYSFRDAIPELNEYLSLIEINDDSPGVLFDWDIDHVTAFVAALNDPNTVDQPPNWLATRPITARSFIGDTMATLQSFAGGRLGYVLLAPNNLQQFGAIFVMLGSLQNSDFLQNAMQASLPVNEGTPERHLATTYYVTSSKAQHARKNKLVSTSRNGQPLRRLFS